MARPARTKRPPPRRDYRGLIGDIASLLEAARRTSARAVNALMTATYWEIGRRIVEFEQGGRKRAGYGEELLRRLAADLTARFGRGFSQRNLQTMRLLYLALPPGRIWQTLSAKSIAHENRASLLLKSGEPSIAQTLSAKSVDTLPSPAGDISETPSRKMRNLPVRDLARAFPLPWSHYVMLLGSARSPEAFAFYHTEALRGGWSVRQLRRQIDSQFYERTALSRDKVKLLASGARARSADILSADEEVKDPLVLEFLGLRDEYSETDLEDALIRHLETFLLELGNDFAVVGRQRRLRLDDEWYRIDLLFFHRRLRCLLVIDLKLGRFNHADAGQMHLYLNYAREHWTQPGENPPVGLILCSDKGESLVRYATDNLPNKVVVRDYLTALPAEKRLAAEIASARRQIEARR